ncbi:MAG: tetratricopeptide repeat protein [bacterium]|nr:tetratricopeptide repeat protein [bacterium]
MGKDEYLIIKSKVNLIREFQRKRKYVEAEKEIQDALRKHPDNGLLLNCLAEVYVRQKNYREASLILERRLRSNPRDFQALALTGELMAQQGRYQDSLPYFEQALSLKESSYLYSQLVRALTQAGQVEKALNVVNTALEAYPMDAYLLEEKGKILRKLKKFSEAAEAYEKVLKADPDDSFAYKEYIRLKSSGQSNEELIRELKAILKVPSRASNPYLHTLLGDTYKAERKYEAAALAYQQALKLAPDNYYVLGHLGFCYLKLQRYSEAQAVLRLPFIHDPMNEYLRSALISAYRLSGNIAGLIETLEEALRKHPRAYPLISILKSLR